MKTYITINLNKAESAETRLERIREQTRWAIFGILIFLLFAINIRIWMISSGYNRVIDQKKTEIQNLTEQIKLLQSRKHVNHLICISVTFIADILFFRDSSVHLHHAKGKPFLPS